MVCLEWREMRGHWIRLLSCVGPNSPFKSDIWGIYLFLIESKTDKLLFIPKKLSPWEGEFNHLIIILIKKVKLKLLNHIYFDLWL